VVLDELSTLRLRLRLLTMLLLRPMTA